MKKTGTIFATLSMIAILAVSCQKEPVEGPSMNSGITVDESITVNAQAANHSVSFKLKSPVKGGKVEAINPDGWVNNFEYVFHSDSTGIISFNVDQNTEAGDRETTVTVTYTNATDPAVFTVIQANPSKVFAYELENSAWEATYCRFHRDSTIFNEVNPEIQSELWYIKITAGEYADQYAKDWNMANPDNLISPEDALAFEFTESPELTTFYNVRIYDGMIEISDGMTTPAGGGELLRVYGEYTYDENTGIMQIHDIGNELYERDVTYQIKRNGDHLDFRCIYMWWPDNLEYYFGDDDRFGFVLPNYDGSRCFMPFGYLLYELVPMTDESENTEE